MKKKIISCLAIFILTLSAGLLFGPSKSVRADTDDVKFSTQLYLELNGQQNLIGNLEVTLSATNTAGLSYQTMLDGYTQGTGASLYKLVSTLIGYANGTVSKANAITIMKSVVPYEITDANAFQLVTSEINNYLTPVLDSSIDQPRTTKEASTVVTPTLSDDGSEYIVNPPFILYMVANDSQTTIKYSVPDGVTAPESKIVRGYGGENPVNIDSPAVPGYVPDKQTVSVNFATGQENTITVHYAKPGTTGTSTSSPAVASSSSSAASTTSSAAATTPQKLPNQAPIYALKKVYLYHHPTFKKQQRLATYPQTKRAARPMFVVLGTAYSKNGLLRYHVKDVNHQSKTAGKTGYVTTDSRFVASVYYQKSAKQVKVLAPAGISEYRNVNLTSKVKTLKTRKTVKVVGLKHYHQTTRFVLSNGHYITANKKLVIAVK